MIILMTLCDNHKCVHDYYIKLCKSYIMDADE